MVLLKNDYISFTTDILVVTTRTDELPLFATHILLVALDSVLGQSDKVTSEGCIRWQKQRRDERWWAMMIMPQNRPSSACKLP